MRLSNATPICFVDELSLSFFKPFFLLFFLPFTSSTLFDRALFPPKQLNDVHGFFCDGVYPRRD